MAVKTFDFTVDELIGVFESQLKMHEHPVNTNLQKWGAWYGMNGVSYCGIGVDWCFAHVKDGKDLRKIGVPPSYTPTFLSKGAHSTYFTKVSRMDIRRGDILFFDFPDKVYRTQHVGIATGNWGHYSGPTIEFNTSPSDRGSQDNGGGVYRKIRYIAHVSGVLRPHYANKAKAPAKPHHLAIVRRGDKNSSVTLLQKRLIALGYGKGHLTGTGTFGPLTEQYVEVFQRNRHLKPDGVVGPLTWKELGY